MQYPDPVTVLRATGPDAYGNPARDWTAPTPTATAGMLLGTALFLPAETDILPGDRIAHAAELYTVDTVTPLGPGRAAPVALVAALTRLPDGA